jgi:hypothetical protein
MRAQVARKARPLPSSALHGFGYTRNNRKKLFKHY